jgi:hypothetical protein
MNSVYHAKSSAHNWGGDWEQYLPIHEFIDSSKQFVGDFGHRALLHSTWGCFLVEQMFGPVWTVGKREIPVREIAERHIIEDLGWLPSPGDYLKHMERQKWMSGKAKVVKTLDELKGA